MDNETEIYEQTATEVQTTDPPVNKWALRDRLRSKALWAAVAGLVVTILSALDAWEAIGITAPQFTQILTAIGAVLTAFGIFNDPTSKDRF